MTFKELPVGSYFHFSDSILTIVDGKPKPVTLYRKVLSTDNLPSDVPFDENEHCFILNDKTGTITKALSSHMDEKVLEVLKY